MPAALLRSSSLPGTKKTAPYPLWDKSCTPAIPPKLTCTRPLASRTIMRARWITGGGPVGIYLVARSSRPPESIRPILYAVIPPPTALFGTEVPNYFSPSLVYFDEEVVPIIVSEVLFVNPHFLFFICPDTAYVPGGQSRRGRWDRQLGFSLLKPALAALCSASFLLRPSPWPMAAPFRRTST